MRVVGWWGRECRGSLVVRQGACKGCGAEVVCLYKEIYHTSILSLFSFLNLPKNSALLYSDMAVILHENEEGRGYHVCSEL